MQGTGGRSWWLAVTVVAAGAFGCGPRATDGGFDSDNPAARLYAIRAAADAGDRAAIPRLVEELDSDDPAVRLWAIHALEELTGQRLNYNPYAGPEGRAPAVAAWRAAVDAGRFGPTPANPVRPVNP